MLQLKLGCDPELFLSKGGQIVSAYGLIPGTKEAPHAVHRGAVQVDGTAAEIGIEPALTKDDWLLSIDEVLQQLGAMVPEFDIRVQATVEYDPGYLSSLPAKARELGCDPDFNAYTMEPNPRPDEHPTRRTGGGHIHLGWGEGLHDHMLSCAAMVRQMDFYLGMPSLLWDRDAERRLMYGKAGAFRPKSYGVEYRTLSNKWLEDEWLRAWAFDNATTGFKAMAEEGEDLFAIYGSIAQEIINTNDAAKALEWCHKLGITTGLRQ